MSVEFRREMLEPPTRPPITTAGVMLLAGLLTLLCAWQLFGLPGAVLKKLRIPEDMPTFGFGLAGVNIKPDGTWVIRREAYADRMGRYEISPDGLLTKQRQTGLSEEPNVIGTLGRMPVKMEGRAYLQVRPSQAYFDGQQELRRKFEKKSGRSIGGKEPLDRLEHSQLGEPPPPAKLVGQAAKTPLYVLLNISQVNSSVPENRLPETVSSVGDYEYHVLDGHQFYRSIDSAAYRAPDLWLTTDRGKLLHRLKVSETEGGILVGVLKTVETGFTPLPENSIRLGREPSSGRLFIVRPSGERDWYDPESLALLAEEKLPGDWEREFGAITLAPETGRDYLNYSTYGGWALTEAAYKRIQRGLLLVMLGGLLVLVCLWRTPWRFISAATTAASSSKNEPSST